MCVYTYIYIYGYFIDRETYVSGINPCGMTYFVQVGGERFNFFSGCPGAKTQTFILRGGAEQFIEEVRIYIYIYIYIYICVCVYVFINK